MAVNIHNLVAAINPDLYCEPKVKNEVKSIVKERGYPEAAQKAEPKESLYMDIDEIYYKDVFSLPGIKNPIETHSLVYDAFGENLEPVYFWILDNLNNEYNDMKKVDKLVDNFISSPGSGHFSEMGQKTTRMQEEGMKMLGAANQVVKSILNIVYDLKEFKLRLELYNKLKSTDEREKNAAILSLKQIWIDNVDIKRGTTSIKGLVQQLNYVTIIDAFMAANSLASLDKLDLNERVRRILNPRVAEFFSWLEQSEKELRKRYEIEKLYLKSQVNTVKLYARWAKPYFKAVRQLEQRASSTAALVTAFNTVLFELVLLGEAEYDPNDDVNKGDLPEMFRKVKAREYKPIIIVELNFRSVPERAGQQGYGFRGRLEAKFTSYALNDDELKILREQIDKDDLEDVFKLVEGATSESLEHLKEEIESFLEDEKNGKEKEEERKKENGNDTNPFSAIFSFFKSSEPKSENSQKNSGKGIAPDSSIEKVIRSQAIIKARKECRKMYDLYKKSHSMPAF